jgi:Trk K+ transport system NAD-binding subunit
MIKTENVSLSSVDELNNEYGINIFAIKQHDKLIVPQRNYHLLINDEVFLFGQQKNIKNFYEKVKI